MHASVQAWNRSLELASRPSQFLWQRCTYRFPRLQDGFVAVHVGIIEAFVCLDAMHDRTCLVLAASTLLLSSGLQSTFGNDDGPTSSRTTISTGFVSDSEMVIWVWGDQTTANFFWHSLIRMCNIHACNYSCPSAVACMLGPHAYGPSMHASDFATNGLGHARRLERQRLYTGDTTCPCHAI